MIFSDNWSISANLYQTILKKLNVSNGFVLIKVSSNCSGFIIKISTVSCTEQPTEDTYYVQHNMLYTCCIAYILQSQQV